MILSFFCILLLYLLLYGFLPQLLLSIGCGILALLVILARILHGKHSHEDIFRIDALAAGDSPLHRCNALLKLVAAVGMILLCVIANSLPASLALLLATLLLLRFAAKIKGAEIWHSIQIPAAFLLLGAAAVLVTYQAKMQENVFCMPFFGGFLMVTRASQLQAMHLICNAAASVSLLYLFGMTTPMPQIITALQTLHLPKVMIELMFLIYRYLFLLFETLSQMQKAAASRLGYRTATASWRSAKRIAASLMLQSFAKANASFDAMEARCYQGTLCFLNRQQRITAGQILAVCGISVCFVGIWLSALRLGWNW